jgi:hypothetical protein
VSVGLIHNFLAHAGELDILGQVADAKAALSVAAAFGYTLNRGWDLTGPARANLRREWSLSSHGNWNGEIDVSGAELAAAGLNQPVELQQARLMWLNGRRRAQIFRAEGFGATWSGNIFESDPANPDRGGAWLAILNADHLDATELDRWVGPRSRPGWLERLLPSLLGGKAQEASGSELVRSLNVAGELRVDEFTVEKLKLQQVHLQGSLHDLQLDVPDGRAGAVGRRRGARQHDGKISTAAALRRGSAAGWRGFDATADCAFRCQPVGWRGLGKFAFENRRRGA